MKKHIVLSVLLVFFAVVSVAAQKGVVDEANSFSAKEIDRLNYLINRLDSVKGIKLAIITTSTSQIDSIRSVLDKESIQLLLAPKAGKAKVRVSKDLELYIDKNFQKSMDLDLEFFMDDVYRATGVAMRQIVSYLRTYKKREE